MWTFTAPRYEGTAKTKLRFMLDLSRGNTRKYVYSEEFDGSVNPEQFGDEKEGHTPDGVMDPYDD